MVLVGWDVGVGSGYAGAGDKKSVGGIDVVRDAWRVDFPRCCGGKAFGYEQYFWVFVKNADDVMRAYQVHSLAGLENSHSAIFWA